MIDKNNLNSKEGDVAEGNAAPGKQNKRRTYVQPKILSAECLEAAAATCDGSGGFGKSVPTCNPRHLGS